MNTFCQAFTEDKRLSLKWMLNGFHYIVQMKVLKSAKHFSTISYSSLQSDHLESRIISYLMKTCGNFPLKKTLCDLFYLGNVLSLKGLNLRNCPIRSPPREVVDQGLECILQYLRSIQRFHPGEHLVRSVTGHSSNRPQGDHYSDWPQHVSAICSFFSLFHSFKKGGREKTPK